jgi:ATP phosphoribosyltransferase involved in histidine biosynthesis
MSFDISTLSTEEKVSFALRKVYNDYGYKRYYMSKFEEYGLYLENKSFLPSDNIITFNDLDGRLMALKPDVTLSIAKNAKDDAPDTEKVYYIENVYRLDKNVKKYREISQMGLEAIGNVDAYTTFEVLLLALKSLKEIDEDFVLDISSVGVVIGVIDSLHVTDYSVKEEILGCIVSKNLHDLKRLAERAGLTDSETKKLSKLITLNGNFNASIDAARALVKGTAAESAVEELQTVCTALLNTEFKDNIRLDFSIINDINYYNGVIFSGYVSRVPRAVLSGGRYDKLLKRLNKKSGAIGFALYLDEVNNYYYNTIKYDVDTLILYDKTIDIANLNKTVDGLISSGRSVKAETTMPSELKFKNIIDLKGGEKMFSIALPKGRLAEKL